MAGAQIAIPANGAADWSDFVTVVQRNLRGWLALTLTNYAPGNTALPAIAAGSALEVGGAIYTFDTEEAITGWSGIADDTDVWIKVVPSGTSITAVFTATTPTWSDAKQGWYTSNDRCIAWLRRDGSSLYSYKHLLTQEHNQRILLTEEIDIGDWNMNTTITVAIAHELEALTEIRHVRVAIKQDTDASLYDLLIAGDWDPNTANINLARDASGFFDSAQFEDTSYNRGYIFMTHLVAV